MARVPSDESDEALLARTPRDTRAFAEFYRRWERPVAGFFVRALDKQRYRRSGVLHVHALVRPRPTTAQPLTGRRAVKGRYRSPASSRASSRSECKASRTALPLRIVHTTAVL